MVKIGISSADVETRRETFPKELRGTMSDSVLEVRELGKKYKELTAVVEKRNEYPHIVLYFLLE